MRRWGDVARSGLALLATAALIVSSAPPAAAAPLSPRTYDGPAYSAQITSPPTGSGDQSKLWFHADAWWAMLLEPSGRAVRVFELMPDHTWRPTSAVVNPDAGDAGDARRDGDAVHVVNRRSDGTLYYVRLTFDPATRDYRAAPPVFVTDRGPRSPATIVKDSTGRLWVCYATASEVVVLNSTDGGLTWSLPALLATTGTGSDPEAASMEAFDAHIGILWTNRSTGTFEFASHRDVDPPGVWAREQAKGGPTAGDRISLRRVEGTPSDTLVAAVKTSPGNQGEAANLPLIEVLVRAPGGVWTSVPVSTVADALDQPVLSVDEETRTLYLFASANGDIVSKQASLDDLTFLPGPGSMFVFGGDGRLAEPTAPRERVGSRSGVVILATDVRRVGYFHAEAPIVIDNPVPDPNDVVAPEPPALLQGRAQGPTSVVLSWEEVVEAGRWSAGRDGLPVQGYVVLRDGDEIATVTTTYVRDQPRDEDDAAAGTSVEYQVQAVDLAGNRSEPSRVVVDLPAADTGRTAGELVGLGLLGVALPVAAAAGYVTFRRRRPA